MPYKKVVLGSLLKALKLLFFEQAKNNNY